MKLLSHKYLSPKVRKAKLLSASGEYLCLTYVRFSILNFQSPLLDVVILWDRPNKGPISMPTIMAKHQSIQPYFYSFNHCSIVSTNRSFSSGVCAAIRKNRSSNPSKLDASRIKIPCSSAKYAFKAEALPKRSPTNMK